MRVLHVVSSISRSAGGSSRSVQGHVAGLNAAGVQAWLVTLRYGEMPWVDGVSHFVNGEPLENALNKVKPAGMLKEATSVSDLVRREMGTRGKCLVDEKYTWNAVVKPMVTGYRKLLQEGVVDVF